MRPLFVIPFSLLLLHSVLLAQPANKSSYTQIVNRYLQWKEIQYKAGTFEPPNRCNWDTARKENYKGPNMGIPDDIDISFTDINGDKKLDALITFFPDQCDGGNAFANTQIRVLILSKGTGYTSDDRYLDNIQNRLKKGWLIVERAQGGTFYGTFYELKNDDGDCCPSIKKKFSIDYKTRKLNFDN